MGSDIDDLLGLQTSFDIDEATIEDFYYGFLLSREAEMYGARTPTSQKFNDKVTETAIRDWLRDFNPEKWTLKKFEDLIPTEPNEFSLKDVDNFSMETVLMTEILASQLPKPGL